MHRHDDGHYMFLSHLDLFHDVTKSMSSLSPRLLVKSLLPAFIFPMTPSLHGAVQFCAHNKTKKSAKIFFYVPDSCIN